jgi:hypothetical protein
MTTLIIEEQDLSRYNKTVQMALQKTMTERNLSRQAYWFFLGSRSGHGTENLISGTKFDRIDFGVG